MSRLHRTPRSQKQLLQALDDHQFLVRNALHGLREDRAHIKALASELRVLICSSSRTEGLLWRLADALKVSDVIELHVAESVNRDHPLNQGMQIRQMPFRRPGYGPPAPSAGYHRLRDVIENCEAIYVAQLSVSSPFPWRKSVSGKLASFPYDRVFTHELLIKAIAEQMGGAHEDAGLEYALVQLNSFLINHTELYFKVLAFDAELTLQIVERVLDKAEQNNIFRRLHRSSSYGDVTLCVRFARTQILCGRIHLGRCLSHVSEAAIMCSAGPLSAIFTLLKRGAVVAELHAPYPKDWAYNIDALFTLSYSSTCRQARTITNDRANGEPISCDIGWMDAKEMRWEPNSGYEEFISFRCVPLYARFLSPKECGELLEMSPEGWELNEQAPAIGPFPL